MAKSKLELLEEAKKLKLDVTPKNTIAEITAAIKAAGKEEVIKEEPKADKPVAKAGKRSEKAIKEVEEKLEKEEKKAKGDTAPAEGKEAHAPKKGAAPKTRPKLERHGKKFKEAVKLVDKTKTYSLADALDLAVKTSTTKFDSTVEIHAVLGVDPRQADQNIRSTVSLPHGTGKTIRVAAFVPEEEAAAAKKAGADIAGEDAITKLLEKEQLDFDVLIATPQAMAKLGKYARVLGPRGLMPNPKSGTVATNVAKAVSEAKGGKVEYRVDKQSIVHLGVGKVSFGTTKIQDNTKVFFENLQAAKPGSIKGIYIKTVYVGTTMGPSIQVDTSTLL